MTDWVFRQVVGAGFGNTQLGESLPGTTLACQSGSIFRSTDGGATWAHTTDVFSGGDGTFVWLGGLRWAIANYPGRDPSVSIDDGLNFTDTFAFAAQSNSGAGNNAGEAVFALANNGYGGWTTDAGVTWNVASGTWPFPVQPSGGALIYDGAQYVAVIADTVGGGDIYTAPPGFSQGAGPTWTHVGSFTNGIGFGGGLDNLVSFDASVGYVAGGKVGGDAAVFISPTVAGLLTAVGQAPGSVSTPSSAVFASVAGTVLMADFLGNMQHSIDGGATFLPDNLNFFNVSERCISIRYDVTHGQLIAMGAQGSISTLPLVNGATAPNVVGLTVFPAQLVLSTAGLTLGNVTNTLNPAPAGQIISQNPVAGTTGLPIGSGVDLVVSLGPSGDVVPNLVGNSVSSAAIALISAGLDLGTVTFVTTDAQLPGNVVTQSVDPGTIVPPGTMIDVTVAALVAPFDVDATVISQYANSPTLIRLVENMAEYIDPRTNFEQFYNFVWNVDTASGFGLDIWGRIVGVTRLLPLGGGGGSFGFVNADFPYDWENFAGPAGGGGPFFTGGAGDSVILADDPFRVLILTKALANITATTSQALNRLIRNLFPGRGICYVRDNLDMTMTYVFNFALTPIEIAILTRSGAMPHPAGVGFNVVVIPPATFGFSEAGVGAYKPFNFGIFFLPP